MLSRRTGVITSPEQEMRNESQQVPHARGPLSPRPMCINYSCINIQMPHKIKYPYKLDNKQQVTKSMLEICARRSHFILSFSKLKKSIQNMSSYINSVRLKGGKIK
jgi:hypothetical protein